MRSRYTVALLIAVLLTDTSFFFSNNLLPVSGQSVNLPPAITQLTHTSYSNYLMPGAPNGDPQAEGPITAWYGGPDAGPFAFNSTADRIGYSYLDPALNLIKSTNLTSYPGCDGCSGFPYFWFDKGTIVSTTAGTPPVSNAYLFDVATRNSGSVNFDTPPATGYFTSSSSSSWGGFFVAVANKLQYNKSSRVFYSSAIDTNTGSGWKQFFRDNSQVMTRACSNGGSWVSFLDPEVYGQVLAGGKDGFGYSVDSWALEGYDTSNDCVPIIVPTGTDLYIVNGSSTTLVQHFNPRAAYPEYGIASCKDTGPCSGQMVGMWRNILVYWVDSWTGCPNQCMSTSVYYLYDLSTGKRVQINSSSAIGFRSDGRSLIWLAQDPVTSQYNAFIYSPYLSGGGSSSSSSSSSPPIRQITHNDLNLDRYAPQVAGRWASWVNTTGAVKLYLIPKNMTFALHPWQGNGARTAYDQIETDLATKSSALFSMDGQLAVWGVNSHNFMFYVNLTLSAQTLTVKAETLALTALSTPYNKSASIEGLVTSRGWIFVDGIPTGSKYLQIFAIHPPVRNPVIVVPGVAGTYLFSGQQQVWLGAIVPPYASGRASSLKADVLCGNWLGLVPFSRTNCGDRFNLLLDSGGGATAPIRTGRILDYNLLGNVLWQGEAANAYGKLEDKLTSLGYVNGTTMFLFPYDWRLDNAVHFEELDNLISRAENATGSYQVVIVAHSMGGVISWGYTLSRFDRALRIKSLITIDTPYWGAAKVFYAIVDGYGFGNPTADQPTMKIMAQNATAAYQLAPRMPFIVNLSAPGAPSNAPQVANVADICRYNPSICIDPHNAFLNVAYKGFNVTLESGNPGSFLLAQGHDPRRPFGSVQGLENIKSLTPSWGVTWRPNANLVNAAESYFTGWGNWTNPSSPLVPTYTLIGSGYSTLDGFLMRPATSAEVNGGDFVLYGTSRVVLVPHFSDGDSTVPLRGQELNTQGTYPMYFRYDGHDSTEHVAMASNPNSLAVIAEILAGVDNSMLCQNGKYCTHQYSGGGLTATEEHQTTDFTLHSNAELTITDQSGGRLGRNVYGGLDETLPTGTFLDISGTEYASVRDSSSSPLSVYVNGTGIGEFTLEVTIRGTHNLSFSYNKVPVQSGTFAQFTLDPKTKGGSAPSLAVSTAGQVLSVGANNTSIAGPSETSASSTGSSFSSSSSLSSSSTTNGNSAPPPGTSSYYYLLVAVIIVAVSVAFGVFFLRGRSFRRTSST